MASLSIPWAVLYSSVQKSGDFRPNQNRLFIFRVFLAKVAFFAFGTAATSFHVEYLLEISFKMPSALTETQRQTATALLLGNASLAEVATEVNCSLGHAKRMSTNLKKYGTVATPAKYKKGRPPIVDHEMREVPLIPLSLRNCVW
jgi:hypothetical protein